MPEPRKVQKGVMHTPDSQPENTKVSDKSPFEEKAEAYIREEPIKAVSAAFGGGLLLAILPVNEIAAGVVRLLVILLRPLLIVLGVVKLYEICGSRCCSGADKQDAEQAPSEKGDEKTAPTQAVDSPKA